MGKLDVSVLRYLGKKHFRVLSAVEKGMKDHEVVPAVIVETVAALHHGGCHKILRELIKYRLVAYEKGGRQVYGYRLTNSGHDYLALNVLSGKNVITSLGHKIGVGKESDIYNVLNPDNEELCIKLHRLGRSSFRQVKNKRDYHKNRSFMSWIHLSSASASKEFHFLKALHDRGFAVPKPVDCNRHAIVMELIDGTPMHQLHELSDPASVYDECMNFIVKLASCGLIHGDFNEFNIMIKDDETIIVYDLPQAISTSHMNAEFYFDRDVQCIRTFFQRRFGFIGAEYPVFKDTVKIDSIDAEVKASGFSKTHLTQLAELFEALEVDNGEEGNENCTENGGSEEGDDSCQDHASQDDEYVGKAGDNDDDDDAVTRERMDSGCTSKKVMFSKLANCDASHSASEADESSDDTSEEFCGSSKKKNVPQDGDLDGSSDESVSDADQESSSKGKSAAENTFKKGNTQSKCRSRRVAASNKDDRNNLVKKEIKRQKHKEKLRTAQNRVTKPRHRKNERRDASSSVKLAPIWDF